MELGSGWNARGVWAVLASVAVLGCGSTSNKDSADAGSTGDGTAGESTSHDTGSDATSSGTTGSTTASPGSIASLDDMLDAMVSIACNDQCTNTAVYEVVYGADCLELYTKMYDVMGASIQRSFDAGTMSFDAAAAQRCVGELAGRGCGAVLTPAVCYDAFVGLVPLAGECTDSLECAGGAHCDETLACPGSCVASLGEGDTCTSSNECDSGLACMPERVCGAPLATGEPCDSGAQCETGYCNDFEEGRRCAEAPRPFSKLEGEPCELPLDCGENLYCPDIYEEAPTCTPAGNLGDPCVNVVFGSSCTRGGYCALDSDPVHGVCVERVALGETCTVSEECATGICDGDTCAEHSGLGEPCVTDARCLDAACVGGICTLKPACPID